MKDDSDNKEVKLNSPSEYISEVMNILRDKARDDGKKNAQVRAAAVEQTAAASVLKEIEDQNKINEILNNPQLFLNAAVVMRNDNRRNLIELGGNLTPGNILETRDDMLTGIIGGLRSRGVRSLVVSEEWPFKE